MLLKNDAVVIPAVVLAVLKYKALGYSVKKIIEYVGPSAYRYYQWWSKKNKGSKNGSNRSRGKSVSFIGSRSEDTQAQLDAAINEVMLLKNDAVVIPAVVLAVLKYKALGYSVKKIIQHVGPSAYRYYQWWSKKNKGNKNGSNRSRGKSVSFIGSRSEDTQAQLDA